MADARVPQSGDDAPDVELLDEQRRKLRLSELWAAQPLVLLFYRGDWSAPCREQLIDFRNHALAFTKAGARLAALSVDETAVSAYLRLERGFPFPLLCDPQRVAVDAWGLLDRSQQGGVARPAAFVIDRAGHVRTRSLEDGERRVKAEALVHFLQRGGASGSRPVRARVRRALYRVRLFEERVVAGLRAFRPGRT